MFFFEVEGHMQKLSSFGRGKKIQLKKSLTWFLQAALQLKYKMNEISVVYLLFDKLKDRDFPFANLCILLKDYNNLKK